MRIYLVQHGQAHPKDIDPERNLTDQGQQDVQRIAAFLANKELSLELITHSGKTRAKQTSEILASALNPARGVTQTDGLSPNEPIEPLKQQLDRLENPRMIVGHLPFLSKLTSKLVTGTQAQQIVSFEPGTILCLEKTNDQNWKVCWMIKPQLME